MQLSQVVSRETFVRKKKALSRKKNVLYNKITQSEMWGNKRNAETTNITTHLKNCLKLKVSAEKYRFFFKISSTSTQMLQCNHKNMIPEKTLQN